MKHILIISLLLALLSSACDPLETGDAPTLTDFSAKALNEDQIELSWTVDNIEDDLIADSNLRAGIWVSADGLNIDNLGSPITTAEGALSYTLVGLDAETEYDVLVRINDRVQYSEAVAADIKSVTTLANGEGSFGPAIATTGIGDPISLVVGRAVSASGNVGLLSDSEIVWYAAGADNTLAAVTSNGTTGLGSIGGTIRDAYLVPVVSDSNVDHLFVAASSGLIYYDNVTDAGVALESAAPRAGTFTYRLDNGLLDVFSYVSDGGNAQLFLRSDVDDSVVFSAVTYPLNDADALFTLAKLDDDEYYDAVIFDSEKKVRIALGIAPATNSNVFNFDSETELATLTPDELGAGFDVGSMFVEQAGGENNNIYIFVRNEEADLTRLIVFSGNGDGTFNDFTITEYDHHFFAAPIMASTGGTDTVVDLLMVQTSSNNVAIYSSGNNQMYKGPPTYYGIDGIPSQVYVGDLNGGGPELIVYDDTNKTISVLGNR